MTWKRPSKKHRAAEAIMDAKQRLPLWASNLIVFGLFFLFVMVYFAWQINQAKRAFLEHVSGNAQLVAEIIQLNARGALLSQQVTGEILDSFLRNTARFVDYLDSIEPFTSEELTAYAKETNLAGIRIEKDAGYLVAGPPEWHADLFSGCDAQAGLRHLQARPLYLFAWPREQRGGCILIGMDASSIDALQVQLSLDNILKKISALPGICYVSQGQPRGKRLTGMTAPVISLPPEGGRPAAEFRVFVKDAEITIGICIDYLILTLDRLWRYFLTFSAMLALLGALLSFALYRQQVAQVSQVQSYERAIAREKEDAAVGRAAAAIAHEVRNPLNAIKMGLQRLQLEARNIIPEHGRLVELLLEEVRRTNTIVTGLLNYARPLALKLQPVSLAGLIEAIANLYKAPCAQRSVQISTQLDFAGMVSADPDLLHQALENLIKNAIEAQPAGGFVHIGLGRTGKEICLSVRNGGFALPASEADRIFEPYFTTKPDGTGLGLNIAWRIIQAHEGRMQAGCPEPGILEITLRLPLTPLA